MALIAEGLEMTPTRIPRTARTAIALLAVLAMPTAALASQAFAMPDAEPDLMTGKDINGVCAGCHGEFGQGGKNGEYPRIAGMPRAYLFKQIKLFQKNTRPNLPMLEHVHERQLSDQEILDISAFVEKIELPTRLPPVDETAPGFNAYQRLLDSKKVVQIPVYEGDTAQGERIYNKECRSCHGKDGWGDPEKAVPQLAGQYTEYLLRQVAKYVKKLRVHDEDAPDEELLAEFSEQEIRDILAYLSIVDD
jgi:cytochrome c553